MNDNAEGIAHALEERGVRVVESNGREQVFAHRNMMDVTKRANKRTHVFLRLGDLVKYAVANGNEKSAVFYNDEHVSLQLDETWSENESRFNFERSDALNRWINPSFTQESLIDHLQCWGKEVSSSGKVNLDEVILRIIKLEMAAKINYERKYDDENNIKLTFTIEEGGNGQALLPKEWTLSIPVFDGSAPVAIPVRMKYRVPRNDNEKPTFSFDCPTLSSLIESETEKSAETLRNALSEKNIPVYKGNV
jgi:hypothetical protein